MVFKTCIFVFPMRIHILNIISVSNFVSVFHFPFSLKFTRIFSFITFIDKEEKKLFSQEIEKSSSRLPDEI